MISLDTCTSSRPRSLAARLLTAATILGSAGCTLVSIDPDTLVADESDEIGQSETADTGVSTNEGSDESSQDDSNSDTSDTAADETSSDEGTTTEEGNDTDTGTDGDTTSGDASTTDTDTGETADPMCPAGDDVTLGQNPVSVVDGVSSYEGSCGGVASETLYWFTAPAGGDYYFTLSGADFSGVLYLLYDTCAEIADACSNSGAQVSTTMSAGETLVVVVDSDGGSGSATLTITGL